jgi:hypothetical protein
LIMSIGRQSFVEVHLMVARAFCKWGPRSAGPMFGPEAFAVLVVAKILRPKRQA